MKLITEVTQEVQILTEEHEGKKTLFIEGIFMQSEVKNRNGRIYPKSILENEVSRYLTEKVRMNRAVGELGHPAGPTINPERISHLITNIRTEGNNFIGKAKISSTPYGQIVRGLIEDGVQLGVSSRALGNLKEDRGALLVQPDLKLITVDVVTDPSGPDCFVNGILEGVDWVQDPIHGWKAQQFVEDTRKALKKGPGPKKLSEGQKAALFEQFMLSLVSK